MDRFRFCRTIIVESDILICSVLEETLKLIGFSSVDTASSASAGLHLIREGDYDLVLLDWALNRDIIQAIRTERSLQNLCVVATSPDNDPRRRIAIIQAGADALISAPFSKATIFSTMDHVLKTVIHARRERRSSAQLAGNAVLTSRFRRIKEAPHLRVVDLNKR